jgi:acyl carrier protein|tara:strand:- start:541 stop:780 length:240 start_codon:yes stop_codon:yes gene_type:complete
MSNSEKYKKIFINSLSIDENKFNEDIKYNEIDEWDSIGHMTLMSALEEDFKITLETDDIVDFSSFKKGIEILKKYNVSF